MCRSCWPTRGAAGLRAATAACGFGGALALTGALVRTASRPLLTGAGVLDDDERRRLVRRWHGGKVARLAFLLAGVTAFSRLADSGP